MPETLASYLTEALDRHAEHLFLAEVDGPRLTYGEAHEAVAGLRHLLHDAGVRPQDRVAILGPNSINWCLAYIATVTAGAVAVPILADLPAGAVHTILSVAEVKLMFVASSHGDTIENGLPASVERVVRLDDFASVDLDAGGDVLRAVSDRLLELRNRAGALLDGVRGETPSYAPSPEDLAAIFFTSGTTGGAKGVMLTQANLLAAVRAASPYVDIGPADRLLSILPLAHTYECTCGFLAPLGFGVSIHYLRGKPSPRSLLAAFATVRPTMVFAVPLVIDKIYRTRVLPKLTRRAPLRAALRIPALRRALHRKAVRALLEAFGGELRQMGFGGAPLNPEVERFMRDGGFPYFVGYGMTECGPLIAGCKLGEARAGSCGYPVHSIELRIAEPDAATEIGEVQVRGPMVTSGYWRNPTATAELFTPDGFLRTGDLARRDRDGFLHLKGRRTSMLLGPSGENVYPEEIEQLLGESPLVAESLVVMRDGKLVALLVPDQDALRAEVTGGADDQSAADRLAEAAFAELVKAVNRQLPPYARLSSYRLHEQEFEKTATQKIRRHLYS